MRQSHSIALVPLDCRGRSRRRRGDATDEIKNCHPQTIIIVDGLRCGPVHPKILSIGIQMGENVESGARRTSFVHTVDVMLYLGPFNRLDRGALPDLITVHLTRFLLKMANFFFYTAVPASPAQTHHQPRSMGRTVLAVPPQTVRQISASTETASFAYPMSWCRQLAK
jgi:hypothetical protein